MKMRTRDELLADIEAIVSAEAEHRERAAIVAYLSNEIPRSVPTMDPTWTAAFNAGIDYCKIAIERGDHLVRHP